MVRLNRRDIALALAVGTILIGLLAGAADAGAQPRWEPSAGSKLVVPGVGLGGLKLGGRLTPLPHGWKHPSRCVTVNGVHGCVWAGQRASPGRPINGPFILVQAAAGRIAQLEIADFGPNPRRSVLKPWHTPQGVHIGVSSSRLHTTYPAAFRTASHSIYALWGRAHRSVTFFKVAHGAIINMEIDACPAHSSCGVTHG